MKKQKILMAVASLGFALVALPVFANEVTVSGTAEVSKESSLPVHISDRKNNIKDVIKMRQAEHEMRSKRMAITTASSSKDTDVRREEFKKQFDAKKEEVKKKIEDEKIRLTEKLKTIKDERKKEVVKKISGQFQEINTRRLEHFSNVLKQMEEVLAKVKARAEKATTGGADTSALTAKIAAFETAVTTARAAIVAQSAKVYSIEITTEDHLKNNTGATRQALQADLKTVFDLVKNAHESLKMVMKELSKIRIVGSEEHASTTTATTTATVTATATTTTNQ